MNARKSTNSLKRMGSLQLVDSSEGRDESSTQSFPTSEALPEAEGGEVRKLNIRKVRTRELLLTAGREVFADQGFEAPRVQDVARVAGVSRAAFYLHFSSLEELIKAVFAREVHWQLRRYQSLTAEIIQNERKLRGWMERVFASFRQERQYLVIFYRAHSIDPTLMRVILEQRRDSMVEMGTRIPSLGIFDENGKIDDIRLTEAIQLAAQIDDMSTNLAFDCWVGDPHIAIDLIARAFVDFVKRGS